MTDPLSKLWQSYKDSTPERYEPQLTRELERILSLPERDPEALGERLVNGMTRRLRRRGGRQVLKPLQALALAEAHDMLGGFGPLPVGTGKTIISFALPVVLRAKRPLLLLPAKHKREKFDHDYAEYKRHWRHHPRLRVESYELLSSREDLLGEIRPDLIVCDEAHNLKNPKSSRVRKVQRYGRANPNTIVIPLSGTMTSRSFLEYWHLQMWALPQGLTVLPDKYPEVVDWANAMDSKVDYRTPLGALQVFGPTLAKAQEGYGERLRRTPCVWTKRTQDCAASIDVTVVTWRHKEILQRSAATRKTWTTPEGEPIPEAPLHWACQRQLGNGFWYKWKYPAPADWLMRRRDWHVYCREMLRGSRTLDSAKDVARKYPDNAALRRWREVKDTFKPITVPVWFTFDIIDFAADWAKKNDGVIWVEHREVGFEIEKRHGLPFFHRGAKTTDGRSIVSHPGGPVVASTSSVSDGFNLQDRWYRSLVLNALPTGWLREQMIGRFHRDGQQSDTVEMTFLNCVEEQHTDFEQAMADAWRTHNMSQPQKLCLADITHLRKSEL